jgi:hypothetical protein
VPRERAQAQEDRMMAERHERDDAADAVRDGRVGP